MLWRVASCGRDSNHLCLPKTRSRQKQNLGLVEIPSDRFFSQLMGADVQKRACGLRCRLLPGILVVESTKNRTGNPCHRSPAIHLPSAMSYIALERIFCHPLLCMLLKLRYIKGSNPTLSAIESITYESSYSEANPLFRLVIRFRISAIKNREGDQQSIKHNLRLEKDNRMSESDLLGQNCNTRTERPERQKDKQTRKAVGTVKKSIEAI